MSKEDVPFRVLLAYRTFQKTGRIPDVDFMDTYEVKKAYSSMDYGDYSGSPDIAPPAEYPTDDFDEEPYYMEPQEDDPGEGEDDIDLDSRDPTSPKTPARYRDYYKDPAEMNTVQNMVSFLSELRKEKRAEDARQMRPPDNRVQTKLEAFAPGGTGRMKRKANLPANNPSYFDREKLPREEDSGYKDKSALERIQDSGYVSPYVDAAFKGDFAPGEYSGTLPEAPDANAGVAQKKKAALDKEKEKSNATQNQKTVRGSEQEQLYEKVMATKNKKELEKILEDYGYYRK